MFVGQISLLAGIVSSIFVGQKLNCWDTETRAASCFLLSARADLELSFAEMGGTQLRTTMELYIYIYMDPKTMRIIVSPSLYQDFVGIWVNCFNYAV